MKYSSPYISIIVPAYNAEKSLKKSIEKKLNLKNSAFIQKDQKN